ANPRLPRYRGDQNRWTLFGRTFVAVPCPPEIQKFACNLDSPWFATLAEIQKKCSGCVFEEDRKWCFFTPPCYKDSREDGLHVRFREETPEERESGELVF
ncbi:MAG: hypothetical protein LUD52_05165, partial [Opitutae bacterium]|nr:hypothetical protein [Opitutae bacterium]